MDATSTPQRPNSLTQSDNRDAQVDHLRVPASESPRGTRLRDSSASRRVTPIDINKASNARHSADAMIRFDGAGPSPPSTPPSRDPIHHIDSTQALISRDMVDFDFDLADAELLGTGLWSNVYKYQRQISTRAAPPSELLTPPTTPQKRSHAQLYAVKTATRPDAKEVFAEEAHVLDHIQRSPAASTFVIPFLGISPNSDRLVFECADATLQSWSQSFKLDTSLPQLLQAFPSVAAQLTSGLSFLHNMGVVHADIKPSNILLNLTSNSTPRARYADFSAALISTASVTNADDDSFAPTLPDTPMSSAPVSRANSQRKPGGLAAGAGTWSFMAPEQLSSNPTVSEPSYASDVYALGTTLLTALLGDASPYRELEGQNIFLLREALKMGDPIQFVKRDIGLRKRFKAIDAAPTGKDLVADLQRALKKNKADRWSAAEWATTASAKVDAA